MNFDDHINKILNEAYFGGPAEKMSGIKRHVTFEDAAADTYSSSEVKAMQDLADAAAAFQTKVDTEALADRGKKLIEFLDKARSIYRMAAGENKLGKVVAGVHRAIADPLSQYILKLEYGNLMFDQDISDEMIDSVIPTFLTKQGEFTAGTEEGEIIETTLEMVEDFKNSLAGFDFARINAEMNKLGFDKQQQGYAYEFCGDCEGGLKKRIREADPIRGIKAEFSTGGGWDHNGFRIEAISQEDLGDRVNLYDNLENFNVVTLVGPHSNPARPEARIATIKI